MGEPEIRYARNGGVSLAYEVVGEGPVTLLTLLPCDNLEIVWENPLFARYLRRLSELGRLVLLDCRGTGLSDRFSPDAVPPLEELVDDITVVLDAVGAERAVLYGFEEAAAQVAMFAATRPDRVTGLVMYAPTVCGRQYPDYPWQWSDEEWESYLHQVRTRWGTDEYGRESLALFNPSHADDALIRRWWIRHQRLASSPGGQAAIETQIRNTDVRSLLPSVAARTLVLHRRDDAIEPVGQGRYVAEQIPDARFVELAGIDHQPWAGDSDAVVAEIEKFLVELRASEDVADRVLATVLITDLVGSTGRVAAVGDTAWRSLIAQHRRQARAEVARFRGQVVDTAGDGLLATFDGPARAVRCAQEIARAARDLDLEVRAGCHTGEIELLPDGVGGLSVHIAARVASLARPDEVWTSSTVRDLTVGSGLRFEDAGVHALRGVPGEWQLFRVGDRAVPDR